MNKKSPIFFLLLTVAVLCCVSITALAAEPLHKDFVSKETYPPVVTSAYVVQDTLFAISKGEIVAFSAPGNKPVCVVDLSAYPEINKNDWNWLKLTGNDATLYLLNPFVGILYEVKDGQLSEFVHLDISNIGKEYGNPNRRYVIFSSVVVMDDYLYLLSMDPVTYGSLEMYRFSMTDGTCKQINLPGLELMEISTYRDEQLLVLDANTSNVLVYDANSEKIIDTAATLPGVDDGKVIYDTAHDALYYLSGARLMRYGRESEVIDRVPFDGALSTSYAAMWQDSYIALADTGMYVCHTDDVNADDGNKDVLTIWVDSNSLDSQLLNLFRLEHPEILIDVYIVPDEEPLERLTTENLSKDSSIDIFLMHTYLIDSEEIFNRGFAAPIKSDRLQNNVLSMYPQIQELLMQNGVLLGYPADLWPDFWTVRPDLLDASGLGEAPETMQEYCDLLLQWYDMYYGEDAEFTFNEHQTIRTQQVNTLSYIVAQYIRTYGADNAPLTFNTPVFRSLMEQLVILSDWYEDDVDTDVLPSIFNTSNSISPFRRSVNRSHAGEICVLPPVFESGEQAVLNASLDYFIINPNTPQYDEALVFMEFYSENISHESRYLLYPNYHELIEQPSYQADLQKHNDQIALSRTMIEQEQAFLAQVSDDYAVEYPDEYALRLDKIAYHEDAIAQAEAALAVLTENRYICSAEDIAEYRAIAEYMSFKNGALVWDVTEVLGATDILMRYIDGTATLDQVIAELDRRVMMMYYEAQ